MSSRESAQQEPANVRANEALQYGLIIGERQRIVRSAITLKPSTLLDLHAVLRKRQYSLLFSPRCGRRPGPEGPTMKLIAAVVGMKQRNPTTWGCPRIAAQVALAFDFDMDRMLSVVS